MTNAANTMMAKDAWAVACKVQEAAYAAMDVNMTEATVSAAAKAKKSQQKAWRVWQKAENA